MRGICIPIAGAKYPGYPTAATIQPKGTQISLRKHSSVVEMVWGTRFRGVNDLVEFALALGCSACVSWGHFSTTQNRPRRGIMHACIFIFICAKCARLEL